jgi:uridine kinase
MSVAGMIDANRKQQNAFVVSICGASNAGKSQLAKATVARLGSGIASRVPVDYFFVPRPESVSLDAFFSQPLRWDWDLLRERLVLPIGTRTSTPDADFDAFQRRAPHGGPEFTVRPIMLCDAMAPFPQFDLVVLIDAPDDERLSRAAERDLRWGTSVGNRWMHLEETWRNASKELVPDLILDGTEPVTVTAEILCRRILAPFAIGRTTSKEE